MNKTLNLQHLKNSFGSGGDQPKAGCEVYTKQFRTGALSEDNSPAPVSFFLNTSEIENRYHNSLLRPSLLNGNKTCVISRKHETDPYQKTNTRELLFNMRFKAGDILESAGSFENRTARCGTTLKYNLDGHVTLKKTEDSLHFTGLETCGSVWNCSVCAMKISKHKQLEVRELLTLSMKRKEYSHGFMTLTIQHNRKESLKESRTRIKNAWAKIQTQRRWKEFNIDAMTSVEVTFNFTNGWHPHYHIAVAAPVCHLKLEHFMRGWFTNQFLKLVNEGRDMNSQTLKANQKYKPIFNNEGISEYITKWDVSHELTHTQSKETKNAKGLKPFDMIKNLAANDVNKNLTDEEKTELENYFLEYSKVFTGKQKLNTKAFQKLKANFEEKTDEEIVNEAQAGEVVLQFSKDAFRQISYKRLQALTINTYQLQGIKAMCVALAFKKVKLKYDPAQNLIDIDTSQRPPPPKPNFNFLQGYLFDEFKFTTEGLN